jgi:hypothetical protein
MWKKLVIVGAILLTIRGHQGAAAPPEGNGTARGDKKGTSLIVDLTGPQGIKLTACHGLPEQSKRD